MMVSRWSAPALIALAAGWPAASPHYPGFAAPVAADTLHVGHPKLRSLALRLGTDTTEVFADANGKRQLVSTGIRTVTRSGDAYIVVFRSEGRRGASIDTIEVAAGTFATRRHVEVQPDHRANLVYRNGHYTGTAVDSTGEHAVDLATGPDDLDFSIASEIMTALATSRGETITIRAYDVALRRSRSVSYRVTGQERIAWHGQDVDAWKSIVDFGTHQVTRWQGVANRRDLQWEISMPNAHLVGITR